MWVLKQLLRTNCTGPPEWGVGRWMADGADVQVPSIKCLCCSALVQVSALIQQKLKSPGHCEVWVCCVSFITDQLCGYIAFPLGFATAGHATFGFGLMPLNKTGSCCSQGCRFLSSPTSGQEGSLSWPPTQQGPGAAGGPWLRERCCWGS